MRVDHSRAEDKSSHQVGEVLKKKNNDAENSVLLNKKQQIFVNLITVTTYSTYIKHFKI